MFPRLIRPPLHVHGASATARGSLRAHCADVALVRNDRRVYALLDAGPNGRELSERLLQAALAGLQQVADRLLDPTTPNASEEVVAAAFRQVTIRLAQVCVQGSAPALSLTLLVVGGQHASVGHVGTGRVSLVRRGARSPILRPESGPETLFLGSSRSHARAREPRLAWIHPEQGPSLRSLELRDGDRIVLSSDGVAPRLLDDPALLWRRSAPQRAAFDLVEQGLTRSAGDDLSCVVLDVGLAEARPLPAPPPTGLAPAAA